VGPEAAACRRICRKRWHNDHGTVVHTTRAGRQHRCRLPPFLAVKVHGCRQTLFGNKKEKMNNEAIVYMLALIIVAVLLFAMVYFIIMFTDLESDYVNPIDLCNKLNRFVLPEMLGHAILPFMFLVSFDWLALIVNLPLLIFNIQKFLSKKYTFDATDIFRTLSNHKKEGFIKLGFYLLCFFFYLYRMIVALVEA